LLLPYITAEDKNSRTLPCIVG